MCVWKQDDQNRYETACGNLFGLYEGTPNDNYMGYCCYCGEKLESVLYEE